ncbi:MAG TPA: hypothetical protein VMV57_09915 [Terracidiphilus sp.]|nr:hypothetical protein [Terracidiphilus sp.]
MIWNRRAQVEEPAELEALDPVLQQSLAHFKASVHAWSADVESRPRTVMSTAPRVRRLAVGWALALLLGLGGVSGVLLKRQHREQLAQQAQQAQERQLEQQRELDAQRAVAQQNLLAKVESDISREVPSAMEPLAQLMTDDATR